MSLNISSDKWIYEFKDHNDWDFSFFQTRIPFLDIIYLIFTLKNLHKFLNREFVLDIEIEIEGNKKFVISVNDKDCLFRLQRGFIDTYVLEDKHLKSLCTIDDVNTDSIYNIFQPIVGSFSSENTKSSYPYLVIDKNDLEIIIEQIEQGIYEY